MKPRIRKLGTLDCDMVETTPIVFRDALYRFEYVRPPRPWLPQPRSWPRSWRCQGRGTRSQHRGQERGPRYWANTTGDSYFRFVEHDTGRPSTPFAQGYHLGNVMVEDDVASPSRRLYVTGSNIWDGERASPSRRVHVFRSADMERWESWNALNLPGHGIFNTSLCRAGDGYVLMFELGLRASSPSRKTCAAGRYCPRSATTRKTATPPLTPCASWTAGTTTSTSNT